MARAKLSAHFPAPAARSRKLQRLPRTLRPPTMKKAAEVEGAVDVEPRPGGRFHCDIRDDAVISGEYVAVEPPARIVFSWGWEGEDSVTPPGSSTVEVLLAADGDGTHLRLIHSDLPSEESATKHGHGWRHYLDRLATAASGGDPGADKFGSA